MTDNDIVVNEPPFTAAIYLTRNPDGQVVTNVPRLVADYEASYDFGSDKWGTLNLALNIIENRIRPIKQRYPGAYGPMLKGQLEGEACAFAFAVYRAFAAAFIVPLDPDAGATIPQASLDNWFFQQASYFQENR